MLDAAQSSCSCPSVSAAALERRRQGVLIVGFSLLAILLFMLTGCDLGTSVDNQEVPGDQVNQSCAVPTRNFADGGVGKDGIPALTDPSFVNPDASEADYLADSDRVIGLIVDGQPYAVPHNILWHHEIANLNFESIRLAVTYCPLTGSSLAFDRAVIDGAEFGVSGLLFNNNLTMYDRTDKESLWPQMNRKAGCGPRTGTDLNMYPIYEMTWDGWRSLHPDTKVVSNNTPFARNYTSSGYPYGDYERRNNDRVLFPVEIDERRPPKERVLGISGGGIPDGRGGIAYPFGALDDGTPVTVVQDAIGEPIVVFWSRAKRGAMAFHPTVNGQSITFEDRNGQIVDAGTESVWTVDGRAIEGPLEGTQLEPVDRAYVAFWFAWALFQPETSIYTP